MITALFAELSNYRVVTRLGSGGMAEVFLVLSERPGGFSKLQVLKLMRSDLTEQERPEFLQMFQDEARLAARLNHPNIVQSFEVGAEAGQPFIVMEFLEGQSLYRVQERARHLGRGFSLEMELFVLCQVLEGLDYAHRLRDYAGNPLHIVHRDVSPQNVFITYSGVAKLVDFGVAKTLESSKTRAGVVKGKVAYMPPEQALAGPIDHRADLFNVGVMLWEAIAGRPMHADLTVFESMSRLVRGDLPRIRDVVPRVNAELERIVTRAIQIDRNERYQDAESFRADLVAYLDATCRVRAREVGAAVEQLFDRERVELGQVIRRAMNSKPPPEPESVAGTVRDITRRIPLSEPRSSNAGSGDVPLASPRPLEPNATPASQRIAPPPAGARPKLGRWALSGLSLLAVLGVGSFFVLRSQSSDARSPSEPHTVTPPPSAITAAPPATVRVAIEVEPKHAAITLDGRERGPGPYMGQEPRDARDHILTITAPGYVSQQRTVRFDADVKLAVQLDKAPDAPLQAEPRTGAARAPKPVWRGSNARKDSDPYIDLPAPKRVKNTAPELDKSDPWAR